MNIIQNSLHSRQRVFLQGGNHIWLMRSAVPQSNCTKLYVFGHMVGEIRGDRFIKYIQGSKHILHNQHAICFDIVSLLEAQRLGAKIAEVFDKENGKVYRTFISTIFSHGSQFNHGHCQQIGLHLNYWGQSDEPFGEQLKMWGER